MRKAAFVSIIVLALPMAALGQARNGNVWDWKAHEPSAPAVQDAERSNGIALPPQQAEQQNREVEQLGHQLLQQTPH